MKLQELYNFIPIKVWEQWGKTVNFNDREYYYSPVENDLTTKEKYVCRLLHYVSSRINLNPDAVPNTKPLSGKKIKNADFVSTYALSEDELKYDDFKKIYRLYENQWMKNDEQYRKSWNNQIDKLYKYFKKKYQQLSLES